MEYECECSCGWVGNHDQLEGEYPNLTCPRCGEPAATHIHDVCADGEVYVCQACGHEDHPDKFGKYCPACGIDLDELEAEMKPEPQHTDDK